MPCPTRESKLAPEVTEKRKYLRGEGSVLKSREEMGNNELNSGDIPMRQEAKQ